MAGDYAGANKVFQQSVAREFPFMQATTVHFRPHDLKHGQPMQLQGKITTLRPNYALIEAEGYPQFICPRSKFGTAKLSTGAIVQFIVEFSAKGPVASIRGLAHDQTSAGPARGENVT
jgi:hypothetical protein